MPLSAPEALQPSMSSTTMGWPGFKSAMVGLFVGVLFGPGALILARWGHAVVGRHLDEVSKGALIDLLERGALVLLGAAFTIYLILLFGRWITRYTVTLLPDRILYQRRCLGISRVVTVFLSQVTAAEAFGSAGDLPDLGYIAVTMGAVQAEPIRMMTPTFEDAQRLVAVVRTRAGLQR